MRFEAIINIVRKSKEKKKGVLIFQQRRIVDDIEYLGWYRGQKLNEFEYSRFRITNKQKYNWSPSWVGYKRHQGVTIVNCNCRCLAELLIFLVFMLKSGMNDSRSLVSVHQPLFYHRIAGRFKRLLFKSTTAFEFENSKHIYIYIYGSE